VIEDTIYTLLSAIGTTFPQRAKQNQALPYMVYTVVSNVPVHRKTPVPPTDVMRLQIDIYADTAKACGTLYESLRLALDHYSGGSIQFAWFDNVREIFDNNADYYGRSVDFMLRINR